MYGAHWRWRGSSHQSCRRRGVGVEEVRKRRGQLQDKETEQPQMETPLKESRLYVPKCLLLRSSLVGNNRFQPLLLALLCHEVAAISAVSRRGQRRLLLVGRLVSVHFFFLDHRCSSYFGLEAVVGRIAASRSKLGSDASRQQRRAKH